MLWHTRRRTLHLGNHLACETVAPHNRNKYMCLVHAGIQQSSERLVAQDGRTDVWRVEACHECFWNPRMTVLIDGRFDLVQIG